MRYARLVALGLVFSAGVAIAQPENDALKGPKVGDAGRKPVLLNMGFDGKVRRQEVRPEEAAVRSLGLAPEDWAKVEAELTKRGAMIDKFVGDNLDLLTKLGTSSAAGDAKQIFLLAWEAIGKLQAMGFDGRLEDRIRALLPMDKVEAFNTAMKEYWSAVVSERTSAPDAKGKKPKAFEAELSERGELIGKELELSYKRLEKSGDLAYKYLMAGLELSARQEVKIREYFAKYTEAGGEDAPQSTQASFIMSVLGHLSPKQQELLFQKLRGIGVMPKPPEPEKPEADAAKDSAPEKKDAKPEYAPK